MGRSPCCSKEGLNRRAWTAKEDMILSDCIRIHGDGGWTNLAEKTGLKRSGKSCRLRWLNYLRPGIKRGNISPDEEELIIRLHRLLGNRWSLIAGRLPGRTDSEIKNHWNTHVNKKLSLMNQSSTTENLKIRSKSPPLLQNHVLVTIPVEKTTAMSESEMVISNGFNDYGCSNHNLHQGLKSCNIKATKNSSTALSNLPVSDSITHDNCKSIAKEGRNPTCSMSTMVEFGRSSLSEFLAEDAATLTENLFDLNDLSSPNYNILSYTFEFCTSFGLEELYMQSATLATEAIQFEVACSDERNMQRVNSFYYLANDQGMEDFDGNKTHLDWMHELGYIQKSSPQSLNSLLWEYKEM
eukprot:PITA_07809